MIETVRNAWKVPELRKKIMFTIFALLIFRLGSAVPVPFIDSNMLGATWRLRAASSLDERHRPAFPHRPP